MSSDQKLSSSWQLDAGSATLKSKTLVGKVDLDNPHRGIFQLCYDNLSLSGGILGVTSEELAIDGKGALDGSWDVVDSYARGGDLVASYHSLADEQVTRQIYWTVHQQASRQEPPQNPLMIDVVVSVQTELLQSFPRVFVSTQLPGEKILFLSNDVADKESVVELNASATTPKKIETPGCTIYRLSDMPWSYVEMAHPADFCNWQGFYDKDGMWQSRWNLEAQLLEKGVIRRFQLRSALLPRKDDLQLARELFAVFATVKPPLTV